ncbi:hypothetical protein HA402_009541 [Bradysia odoriphaga]|nr:hypothetical protein HA402_009541 [Bradysia odoriphaga]
MIKCHTQEFIINKPDFEAAKCWIGNLGKTFTLTVLFAILYTADGTNRRLHGFLVPIRDPRTLQPYSGVLVDDVGEKIGLNGIDNGVVMFNHYRIPRIEPTIKIVRPLRGACFENQSCKILGAALESFSASRLGVIQERVEKLQPLFRLGPDGSGPEVPIIDYQPHQWRIFSAAYVFRVSVFALNDVYLETVEKSQADSNGSQLLTQKVSDVHVLLNNARDAIEEARSYVRDPCRSQFEVDDFPSTLTKNLQFIIGNVFLV